MFFSIISIQIIIQEIQARAIKEEKKKGIHIVKEEAKLSSVVDDMNLHLENAEQSARKSTRTNNQV